MSVKTTSPAVLVPVLFLVLGLTLAPPAAAKKPFVKGDGIMVSGRVVGPEGAPIADVPVLLETTRSGFRLRFWRREMPPPVYVTGHTDATGAFAIPWTWDGFHNRFALVVALPEQDAGGIEVFTRRDVSEEILAGQRALAVEITVPRASILRWAGRLERDELSDDERRIFREMGRPERVDVSEHQEQVESSWWYFSRGKVYHFSAGALGEVMDFEPITR